ncbi:MAG TPA: peptidoglycan-binding domain-containing protein [Candidatus Sulfotelmatobacter sp.]
MQASPQTTGSKTSTKSTTKKKASATGKRPAANTTVRLRSTTAASHSSSSPSKRKRGTSRLTASKRKTPRGQQKIDSERVLTIQLALIREHYLTGEATGSWSQSSEEAMRRYQADHGWQSKTVPDSRALIKLGLGPSHDHLLNPDSAMTTQPDAPRATSLDPVSDSADPGLSVSKAPAAGTVPSAAGSGDPSRPQ